MFETCLWCLSLRKGAIIIAVIYWIICFYICWTIGGDHTVRPREFLIFWRSFGWKIMMLVRQLILAMTLPCTFLTGLFIFIGVFLNSPSYLILSCIVQGVAVFFKGVGACYLLFFFHYVLSVRCLIFFSLYIWFEVASLFLIISLKTLMSREQHIIHFNYMRESFVIPMRRDILDKLEAIPQNVNPEQSSEVP